MNEYLSMIILGLVQGITEFLPVSSSGHLVLLEKSGIGEPGVMNNLLLHCATLLVVLIVYGKDVVRIVRHPTSKESLFLIAASVPTAVCAGLIRYLLPDTTDYLPLFFIVTSVVLLLPSLFPDSKFDFEKKRTAKALFVGAMQGVACFAGVSRSGTTASALLLSGCPKEEVSRYSFLLSIPIIVGSSAVELFTSSQSTLSLAVIPGFVVAFFSGFFSLKLFSRVLEKNNLYLFSAYTFLIAVFSFFRLF